MRFKVTAVFLLSISSSLCASTWEFAPATASAVPGSVIIQDFISLEGFPNLDGLLIESEGWFWLKLKIPVEPNDDSLLISGTNLAWYLYVDGKKMAESGSGPPWWQPSSPIPYLSTLPTGIDDSITILMKVYLRRGYTELPALSVVGTKSDLRRHQLIIISKNLLVPALSLILGFILFIGGLIGYVNRKDFAVLNLALFAFFISLASLEPLLYFFPGLSALIPWIIPAVAVRAAIPPALSFWRKTISTAGGRDPVIITIIDLVLTILVSLWLIIPIFALQFIPAAYQHLFDFNPLPWYIMISVGTAFGLWVYHSIKSHPCRIGSLLIFVTALIPLLIAYTAGNSTNQFISIFIYMSLPASLTAAIPFLIIRKVSNAEEPEVLEVLEELDAPELLEIPAVSTHQISVHEKLLTKSIRSTLYPESIPWDPVWDLASSRQGSSYPATGFHDVYTSAEHQLSGFSFMDSGADSLESLFFAHLVRSELSRSFRTETALPKIVRSVHRKALDAAGAAGKTMMGVTGKFQNDKLVFLPLLLPPMLLKRMATGNVISLSKNGMNSVNPPLGSRGFGSRGLQTLNITMSGGDFVVVYTPSILNLKNTAGEKMGIGRFAGIVKASEGRKADATVAGIIGALKDFSGSNVISVPLQILVIRHR